MLQDLHSSSLCKISELNVKPNNPKWSNEKEFIQQILSSVQYGYFPQEQKLSNLCKRLPVSSNFIFVLTAETLRWSQECLKMRHVELRENMKYCRQSAWLPPPLISSITITALLCQRSPALQSLNSTIKLFVNQ